MRSILPAMLLLIFPAAVGATSQSAPPGSAMLATQTIERAIEALGGEKAVAAARQLTLEGDGTFDDGAWFQGQRPDSRDEIAYRESLVLDAAGDRTGWENLYTRKDGTHDWLRFTYIRQDQMQIAHLVDRYAFHTTDPAHGAARHRLERMVPHVLLSEALGRAAHLRHLGETGVGVNAVERIAFPLESGEVLTLEIGKYDALLHAFCYETEALVVGRATVRWEYNDYRPVAGLGAYPGGYAISVGGRVLKRIRYTNIRPGKVADAEIFRLPEGLTARVIPPPEPGQAPAAPQDPPVKEVVPGLHMVRGLRGGFHVLFAEFKDFVVALEAPTGWMEFHEIPASNVEPGATADSLAETYIRLIKKTVPGKPIRYLVLTHFHSDHAGGLRPFVKEGAVVVGTTATSHVALKLAWQRAMPRALEFQAVSGKRVITDGERVLELLELPANSHVEGMLVAHFPKEKLMYVADFFLPSGPASFPLPSHRPLMRFFVDWLDAQRLAPEIIIASHGSGEATATHLVKVRALKKEERSDR